MVALTVTPQGSFELTCQRQIPCPNSKQLKRIHFHVCFWQQWTFQMQTLKIEFQSPVPPAISRSTFEYNATFMKHKEAF